MKLNVGVSRKVGMPDYGSIGASCNLELEIEASLIDKDLDGFHSQVHRAYQAAHQAVHNELARLQTAGNPQSKQPSHQDTRSHAGSGYSRANGTAFPSRTENGRSRVRKPATPNQIKAILAIARRRNAELGALLRQEYEVDQPEDLTIRQASELIDLLKSSSVA
jgi:hypothetical protein